MKIDRITLVTSQGVRTITVGELGVSEIYLTSHKIDGDPYDVYEVIGENGQVVTHITPFCPMTIDYSPK